MVASVPSLEAANAPEKRQCRVRCEVSDPSDPHLRERLDGEELAWGAGMHLGINSLRTALPVLQVGGALAVGVGIAAAFPAC